MEDLGSVKFVQSYWDYVTYIDLSNLEHKLRTITEMYTEASGICNSDDTTKKFPSCQKEISLIGETLAKLEAEKSLYMDLVSSHKRQKRGYINAVGSISKTLFGTLSAEDADRYDKILSEVEQNLDAVTHLVSEQTSIDRAILDSVNGTLGTIEYNVEALNKTLNNVLSSFQKFQKDMSTALMLDIAMENHINLLNLVLQHFQAEVDSVINAILFAKVGILHPVLITPKELLLKLREGEGFSKFNFVVPLELEFVNELWDNLEIITYMSNNKLVVVLKVPLFAKELFSLYKLIPLLSKISNKTYLFLDTEFNYVANNEEKSKYYLIDNIMFGGCKQVLENLVCKGQNLIEYTAGSHHCEIQVMQNVTNIANFCQLKVIKILEPLFISLEKPNSWLFIGMDSIFTAITCIDKDGKNVIWQQVLTGVGCITFLAECMLTTSENVIYSYKIKSRVDGSDIIPRFNFKFNFTDELPQIIDDPLLPRQIFGKDNTIFKTSLQASGMKLEVFRKEIEEIQHHKALSGVTFGNALAIFIVAMVVMTFIIGYCRKFYCQKSVSKSGVLLLRDGRQVKLSFKSPENLQLQTDSNAPTSL